MEDEPGARRGGVRSIGILIGSALAALSISAHALDAKQCAFAGCAVGDPVVTTPTEKSGPSCTRQGATIFAFYVTHPQLPPGAERDRMEAQLRLQAGARTREEALSFCHPTPAGQRAKVVREGALKTGLLQIAPDDGSAPYWISNFDVSRP